MKYRVGVIGLGWMGLLYDLVEWIDDWFDVDDVDCLILKLDIYCWFHYYIYFGNEGFFIFYVEVLWDWLEV